VLCIEVDRLLDIVDHVTNTDQVVGHRLPDPYRASEFRNRLTRQKPEFANASDGGTERCANHVVTAGPVGLD
jgi:hypothetical protein